MHVRLIECRLAHSTVPIGTRRKANQGHACAGSGIQDWWNATGNAARAAGAGRWPCANHAPTRAALRPDPPRIKAVPAQFQAALSTGNLASNHNTALPRPTSPLLTIDISLKARAGQTALEDRAIEPHAATARLAVRTNPQPRPPIAVVPQPRGCQSEEA